ncbi:MAG: signal peptidase I [Phycisphaeraceae bacterium]|nr:signal peptidase I [Phycisphaeraceae bacterium]
MCHFPNVLGGNRVRAGDRILIHKYIYSISAPRRWDVVVFKNPNEPTQNYIKRLVGLPDESLLIIEGNVYVKPREAGDDRWRIARKTDSRENPHATRIQRVLWQPVYHSRFRPRDRGLNAKGGRRWNMPWSPEVGDWKLGRAFVHDSANAGLLTFDFADQSPPYDFLKWYAYNQHTHNTWLEQPIEDVRVAASVQPLDANLVVRLRTTTRLDRVDGTVLALEAAVQADGKVTLSAFETTEQDGRKVETPDTRRVLAEADGSPLPVGVATPIELWYVDQEASVWVDGERMLVWQFELDFTALCERRPLEARRYPQVEIEVNGAPVALHDLEVDRDIAYTSAKPRPLDKPGRGTMVKYHGETRFAGEPVHIAPEQFFCLGDNSPLSHDGRFWEEKNLAPWIRQTMLPDESHRFGVVPEDLMIGKAFFVYFPAPYPISSNGAAVVPNFGEMRFIR